MAKKSLQQVIKEHKQYGFDEAVIEIAYANVDGDSSKIIQEIFKLQEQSNVIPTKPSNPQDEDAQLSKAIQMSINQAKDKKISLQPLNPEQRVRKNGVPVGLKNIGNTCYFNSLLQTYFQNASFLREILHYQIPQKYLLTSDIQIQKRSQQDCDFKRKLASCRLVQNLKNLFGSMIASDRKYADPTPVLSSIVDDYGNELPVGDQKDIGEFNLIFLSRIDQGLTQSQMGNKMEIQGEDKENQSPSKINVFGAAGQGSQSISLLKHSSIKISDKSIITQEFIGKMSNSFHNQGNQFHKQEEELFSLLFVNVKHKQLYKALEQVVICNIDDYRNQKGEVVGVQKRSWIKQAPKTLFFQIDRVVFDKERGSLQKINDVFDFPRQFYIDPFLDRNKEEALKIQHKVKQLRKEKDNYVDALNSLQSYGQKKFNLLDLISQTTNFFQSQTSKIQIENQTSDPMLFPKLQKNISNDTLNLLNAYKNQIKRKLEDYKIKIHKIETEIEKCYESIRTQPYYLYSILIHEGSADSGHYYSYTYDFQVKTWRKYNDINISEESPQQVMKEAKGINYTSAYYLVYAHRDVLIPNQAHPPVKSYKTSNEDGYLKDYYSSFMSQKLRTKIGQQNHAMYYQIQQYKMGSFTSRVLDSYTKKFEICNEIFRKNKQQKKKNSPPILINLPIYIKSIDQNEYKNCLMQNCISEYGPKEYSMVFQELINKKMTNFNDFKRPKKLSAKQKFLFDFMGNVQRAVAAKKLFHSIKQSNYSQIFGILNQLRSCQPGDYFSWLSNLLSKIIVVQLLVQVQDQAQPNPESSLYKLKILILVLNRFINQQQQKCLINNCIYWLSQINIKIKDQKIRQESQTICQQIANRSYKGEFDTILENKQNLEAFNQIKSSVQVLDAAWNLSRTEDVYISQLLKAREQVKEKMERANQIYKQMKKKNLPLKREERENIKNKK